MEEKKKILYVITKSALGGAQRYVLDLALYLHADHEVILACGGSGPLINALEQNGVRVVRLTHIERDIGVLKEFRALLEIHTLLKRERPDVLHLNSSKAGLLGAIAGRWARTSRIIYTAHGWPFHENRNFLWKGIAWVGSYVTAVLSHVVICVSKFDATRTAMPFVGKKMHVIHTGIHPSIGKPRMDARAALFSPEEQRRHIDDIFLCTMAEHNSNKNLIYALDAVRHFNATSPKKIYYSILGSGEDTKKIKAHIRAHTMADCVKLHGFVADARTYLAAFDIFFLPSKKEGFPYAVLEAGYAQLPVIASGVGGIKEMIESEKYGLLIDPFDISSAVEAFHIYIDTPEKRTHAGSAFKDRVLERYSARAMIKKTTALYW